MCPKRISVRAQRYPQAFQIMLLMAGAESTTISNGTPRLRGNNTEA